MIFQGLVCWKGKAKFYIYIYYIYTHICSKSSNFCIPYENMKSYDSHTWKRISVRRTKFLSLSCVKIDVNPRIRVSFHLSLTHSYIKLINYTHVLLSQALYWGIADHKPIITENYLLWLKIYHKWKIPLGCK